jgi:hypothetical protein
MILAQSKNIIQEMNSDRISTKTSDHLAKRQIRFFISSTFCGMQEERELLVKKVFPDLRRICDERFVSFTEVQIIEKNNHS